MISLPAARQLVHDAMLREFPDRYAVTDVGGMSPGNIAIRVDHDPEDEATFEVRIVGPTQFHARIQETVVKAIPREKVRFR